MFDRVIRIRLISGYDGGWVSEMELYGGTTVGTVLDGLLGSPFAPAGSDPYIRVNHLAADREDVLMDGDVLSFTPSQVQGAVETPKERQFLRHLKRRGFFHSHSHGNHQVWENVCGQSLLVVRSKSDRRKVNYVSVRNLANTLGLSFSQTLEGVLNEAGM